VAALRARASVSAAGGEPVPLDPIAQQLDFSLGTFQSGADEREPDGAAGKIVGLIGDDGLPYRRGGSRYKASAGTGAHGIMWVRDASLRGGHRAVWGAATPGSPNGDRLYALADDGVTATAVPMNVASAWVRPVRSVIVDRQLFIEPDTTGLEVLYGGTLGPQYDTGTIAVTTGDSIVTGTGTLWVTAGVKAGEYLYQGGAVAMIESVDSETQLTVRWEWLAGTGTGLAYLISPSVTLPVSVPSPVYYGSAAGRLLRTNGPNRMDFSPIDAHGQFDPNDYHLFKGNIIGFGELRDVALVFTTEGVDAISNMAFDLVDAATGEEQQRHETVNEAMVLWDRRGIAEWAGALIVPCLDNIYLMDSLGAPTPIGDRILDLYLGYVRAGYQAGLADVFNGEYHLPILSGNMTPVDYLVCRLRPTHSQVSFGWSELSGAGAQVSAVAASHGATPTLLGAPTSTTSRLLDLSGFYAPAAAVKNDADGTTHVFELDTIDYPTGNMVSNFVHHVRVMYELVDGGADNPVVVAEASVDGGAWFTLPGGTAGESPVGDKTWRVNQHGRNVRFRFTCAGPAASLRIKSVEPFVRHSGRQ
jgi:hypothetical protein